MPRAIRFCLVTLTLLTTASAAGPEEQSPSNQEVLTFLADTIDWYRHLPSIQQSGMEPKDIVFIEDNQPLAREIVRLSFEFGKGIAAMEPTDPAGTEAVSSSSANSSLQFLIAARTKLDANVQQTVSQLHSAEQARLVARGADRITLDTKIAELRRRMQLLSTISTDYQNILGFARNTSADAGHMINMAALVDNLERTVPSVSGSAESLQNAIPAAPSHRPYGIRGLISRVSSLERNEQEIESVIDRTAALGASLQDVRTSFARPFRQQVSTLAFDTGSIEILQQQESRVATLVAEAKAASPAISALIRLHNLLDLFAAHLAQRRVEIQAEERTAWKALLTRLGVLVAGIVVLLIIGKVANNAAERHLHDAGTRQVFGLGLRVLIWLIIVITVVFTFAFNLSSLATFLGLLSAGLAVGLHDVFLALAGYLLIVRKFHVRVGDRVQISGVTGEVTKLGLMEFEVSEIEASTGQRTGRVAFFSNSYVFVSPATPLFRQVSA